MSNPNARQGNESFQEYRKRLKELGLKKAGVGKILWDPRVAGTYVRAQHGVLGTEQCYQIQNTIDQQAMERVALERYQAEECQKDQATFDRVMTTEGAE